MTPGHPTPESRLARLGRLAVRRRRLVLATWIAVLGLAVIGGPKVAGDWSVVYEAPGSDSTLATAVIDEAFPESGAYTLPVVWTAAGGAADPSAKRAAGAVARELEEVPGVGRAGIGTAEFSRDGKVGMLRIPLLERPANIADEHAGQLLGIAERAAAGAVTVHVGGLLMQEAQRGAISSEGVGLTVALMILLATFGTVIAAGLPIATALFGTGTGAAVVGIIAALVATPDWAESVALMVGIGVGIDYALLILTRYRAHLHAGGSVEESVALAMATAGRSVLIAGCTVVISLLGLLLMGLPYLQGVALAASSSASIVMIASLTLLPALLGFAGHRVDRFAIPLPGRRRRPLSARSESSERFAGWSRAVQRRPAIALALGLAVIAVISAPLAGVRLGFPGLHHEPPGTHTRSAADLIAKGFGAGASDPLLVAVSLGRDDTRRDVARLAQTIQRNEHVAAVAPPRFTADGSTAVIQVQSTTPAETAESGRLLEDVRGRIVPASGLKVHVTGWTAQTRDQSDAIAKRLPILILGVAGLSALLLMAAFRSILIPLKAAVMNLLSIVAAYGVISALAEGGTLGRLVGIHSDIPIPPFIPVLMFAVLFGLSMDYEVFLLGRIREAWLTHGDPARAVTEGIATTARVITAAAAIMIAVFGAFAFSHVVFLKLIGIGMAAAIFVDATVIRLLLLPAVMQLFGRAAWWMPRWLDRAVPQAKLEATE